MNVYTHKLSSPVTHNSSSLRAGWGFQWKEKQRAERYEPLMIWLSGEFQKDLTLAGVTLKPYAKNRLNRPLRSTYARIYIPVEGRDPSQDREKVLSLVRRLGATETKKTLRLFSTQSGQMFPVHAFVVTLPLPVEVTKTYGGGETERLVFAFSTRLMHHADDNDVYFAHMQKQQEYPDMYTRR